MGLSVSWVAKHYNLHYLQDFYQCMRIAEQSMEDLLIVSYVLIEIALLMYHENFVIPQICEALKFVGFIWILSAM